MKGVSLNDNVSAIIISNDSANKTLAALNNIAPYVGEVIIIYSNPNLPELQTLQTTAPHNSKIHYAINLGLAEVYRQYAENLCKNEWVMIVDTDERFSESIFADLRELTSENTKIAYKLRRYENSSKSFFTWQTRIYRKEAILWEGRVHEKPKCMGQIKKLPKKYYMLHEKDKTDATPEYNRLQRYENESPFILALKDYIINNQTRSIYNPIFFIHSLKRHLDERRNLSDVDRLISREIEINGITKLLNLTDPKEINKLNETYKNGGIDLLILLLTKKVKLLH